jgi:hypothetical protein
MTKPPQLNRSMLRMGPIEPFQPVLQDVAGRERVAGEASHPIQAAVQVDHLRTAGSLVEAIHILGDHQLQPVAVLQSRHGDVCRVGPGIPHRRPTRHGASPVPAPARRIGDEFMVLYRFATAPATPGVAIGRDAGSRTDARTGQGHYPAVAVEKCAESAGFIY